MGIEINITGRKELAVYMNAQRQRLLKTMELCGKPMTPKQLSAKLGISPSSVTYHLGKLKEIGLVCIDHTERIHGIEAKFYRRIPAVVNLRGDMQDGLSEEKLLLTEYAVNETVSGFKKYISGLSGEEAGGESGVRGDALTGVLHLTEEEAKRLRELLRSFHAAHTEASEGTRPWEVALIAFPEDSP